VLDRFPRHCFDAWALARHRLEEIAGWHSLGTQTLAAGRCLHSLKPLGGPASIGALGFAGPIATFPMATPSIDRFQPRSTAALAAERVPVW